MKKAFLFSGLFLVLFFATMGCSKSSPSASEPASTPTETVVTYQVYYTVTAGVGTANVDYKNPSGTLVSVFGAALPYTSPTMTYAANSQVYVSASVSSGYVTVNIYKDGVLFTTSNMTYGAIAQGTL